MAVVGEVCALLSSVHQTADLRLVTTHVKNIVVNAEADGLFVSDSGEVEVEADLISTFHVIHSRHNGRRYGLLHSAYSEEDR